MAARTDELTRFVRDALSRQIPRGEVEAALLGAGWRAELVRRALDSYADSVFPMPVPRPTAHVSAGEAFLYLVLFSALGISAAALVELLFTLIEWAFYDPAAANFAYDGWQSGVRWAIARLVIALPVFLLASRAAGRAMTRDPSRSASPVRRWLTYLAMFIAVAVLIGDLVALVAYVLSGETTIRFLLKVLTVAIVAGGVLCYYLWDLRGERDALAERALGRTLLAAFVLVSLAAAGSGLWLIGSPAEQAARRIDNRRIEELGTLKQAVDLYWTRNQSLPEDLQSLAAALAAQLPTEDPQTGEPYEYRALQGEQFELCASFARASDNLLRDAMWTHGPGRQCFTLTARAEERP
jgi:hypothetical protein